MLAHHPTHGDPVAGARVLDLFAGSGALGIESLSRGASHAVFVERDRRALRSLHENLRSLELGDRGSVWAQDADRAASRLAAEPPFDLVFLDPPYADTARVARLLEGLLQAGGLEVGGRIVLERSATAGAPAPELGLPGPLARRWGKTEVLFYRRPEI